MDGHDELATAEAWHERRARGTTDWTPCSPRYEERKQNDDIDEEEGEGGREGKPGTRNKLMTRLEGRCICMYAKANGRNGTRKNKGMADGRTTSRFQVQDVIDVINKKKSESEKKLRMFESENVGGLSIGRSG
jgi:hypothetical protein